MNVRFPSVAVVAALLAVALPAQSQSQNTDTVPRELALALLRGTGDGVRLLVGKAPEQFPLEAAPFKARILGALQRGQTNTVVFVSAMHPDSAVQAWEKQMRAARWTKPRAFSTGPQQGFISSSSPMAVPGFCNAGVYASLTGSIRYEGGSTLVLTYTDPQAQTLCAVSEESPQIVITPDTVPLPALIPPSTVNVVGYNSGASANFWEQQARISGVTTPAEILKHYAQQMTVAGWKASAVAAIDETATQVFTLRAPNGSFEYSATLTVQRHPYEREETSARIAVYRRR